MQDNLVRELRFIGGVFVDYPIPKDKKYLLKYYTTVLERTFLQYLYCFGDLEFFKSHTGYVCTKLWLNRLKKRHDYLVETYNNAKADMDFNLLSTIENGKYVDWKGFKN